MCCKACLSIVPFQMTSSVSAFSSWMIANSKSRRSDLLRNMWSESRRLDSIRVQVLVIFFYSFIPETTISNAAFDIHNSPLFHVLFCFFCFFCVLLFQYLRLARIMTVTGSLNWVLERTKGGGFSGEGNGRNVKERGKMSGWDKRLHKSTDSIPWLIDGNLKNFDKIGVAIGILWTFGTARALTQMHTHTHIAPPPRHTHIPPHTQTHYPTH